MQTQDKSLTLSIEEAAAQLGIGRTLAYELARRDALPVPVIRLGRRLVVSRAALSRVLGAASDTNGRPGTDPSRETAA